MKLFSKKTDFFYRSQFKNKEYSLLLRKLFLKNINIHRFYKKNKTLPAALVKTRINNSCVLTGRTHAVYRGFRVSRFVLKGMSSLGYLPGIRKCS